MAAKKRARGIAVVTGAGGGMGAASAIALAEAGWPRLLLCDIEKAGLKATAARLSALGAKVKLLVGDIADPDYPASLIEALGKRQIGALVHAAGLSPQMASPERILEVNLGATVRLVEAIRPRMAEGSAAVLYASNSAYFPMPPEAAEAFSQPLPPGGTAELAHLAPTPEQAYPLSKLGVRALVRREAKNFGKQGARLVSVSPGAIDTRMTRGELPKSEAARGMIRNSAIGRIGRPEELAAVCAFLCSPAASLVTAVDWLVDGGQTAAMGF